MKLISCTVETTPKCDTSDCRGHGDVISEDDMVVEGDINQCRHYVRIDDRGTGKISGYAPEQCIVREIASHPAVELGVV